MIVLKNFLNNNYPIILTLLLFLICAAAGEQATLVLRYDRNAILDGDLYRLLSAHFVHLSTVHALMNSVAAVIGWFLFRSSMPCLQWLFSIMGSAVVISLLLLTVKDLAWYVGFSGVVHALMLAGLILDKKLELFLKVLIIGGLLSKVAYEQIHGVADGTFELIGGDVVLEGHLFGLIGGLLMTVIVVAWDRLTGVVTNLPD